MDLKQYHQRCTHAKCVILSLDKVLTVEDGEQMNLYDALEDEAMTDPAEELDQAEIKYQLSAALQTLSSREQKLISLYYQDEMTMKEIGQILNVSESRVSQMHSRIVRLLGTIVHNIAPSSMRFEGLTMHAMT